MHSPAAGLWSPPALIKVCMSKVVNQGAKSTDALCRPLVRQCLRHSTSACWLQWHLLITYNSNDAAGDGDSISWRAVVIWITKQ